MVAVRAGEGVGERVKQAVGAAKAKLDQAGDYLSGKADEAEGSANDARGEVESLGVKLQTLTSRGEFYNSTVFVSIVRVEWCAL